MNHEESKKDNNSESDLILEPSEERDGYVHLRYRDKHGRFSNLYKDPEIEKEKEIDKNIDKFCKEYRKKVNLHVNERLLLLLLVNSFKDNIRIYDSNGFFNPKVSHFKRILYHQVLLSHRLKRSAFSLFIKRMVEKGIVRNIRQGHKLYLKITKLGLKKIVDYYEEFMSIPFM
jgi:hypothetical protein